MTDAQITVDIETGSDGLKYGLRQMWVDVSEDDEVEASLSTGAGLGSPWMILTVTDKVTGARVAEAIDVRTFLPTWINEARERANADGH